MMRYGTTEIQSGVEGGNVEVSLNRSPTVVILGVTKPQGGFQVFADWIEGTATVNGFGYMLSGQTDQPGYKLNWLLIA